MRVGRIRVLATALVIAVAGLVAAAASPAAAVPATGNQRTAAPATSVTSAAPGTMTSTVTGTFTDATGTVGTVTGTFVPSGFTTSNGHVLATGTLTATLTNAAGSALGTTTKTVTLPVQVGAQPQAACPILNLVLGPLDLNLLGLKVHLDRVVLTITAQPGPGNLLGNLLCAIAGLLNGGGSLATLTGLLNQLLGLLNL